VTVDGDACDLSVCMRIVAFLDWASGRHAAKLAGGLAGREEATMQWVDPAYCDLRLGFEVTAYVYVR